MFHRFPRATKTLLKQIFATKHHCSRKKRLTPSPAWVPEFCWFHCCVKSLCFPIWCVHFLTVLLALLLNNVICQETILQNLLANIKKDIWKRCLTCPGSVFTLSYTWYYEVNSQLQLFNWSVVCFSKSAWYPCTLCSTLKLCIVNATLKPDKVKITLDVKRFLVIKPPVLGVPSMRRMSGIFHCYLRTYVKSVNKAARIGKLKSQA